MPGVQVTTATLSSPSTPLLSAAGTFFLAGLTERGPTDKALKVTGLADYERLYGARVTYGAVYDQVRTFFEEGGQAAYVARVVGPAASVSTVTLSDKAGSPVPTLRIDAYGAGAWGASGLTVDVDSGTLSNTFKLTVAYTGTGAQTPEVYDNIATPAEAVRRLAGSSYVRAVDLGSATAAPNNQPANTSPTALTGGSDDRTNVVTGSYTAALDLFIDGFGAGAVAIPGQPASSVGTALTTHAVTHNRIALTATAAAQTMNQAITAASTLQAANTSGNEFTGLFWPWVKIPDNLGGTYTISPEGYVAAVRARAQGQEGPARPPAGSIAVAGFVSDIETYTSAAQVDTLNGAYVSPITVRNNDIQLYGYRSLSTDDTNYHLLSSREVMNYIAVAANDALQSYVFKTIDGRGRLFSQMSGTLIGLLDPLSVADQLYGRYDDNGGQIDPGYSVDTGPGVNTETTKANNIAKAVVRVRPAPAAELVQVQIIKVPVKGSTGA